MEGFLKSIGFILADKARKKSYIKAVRDSSPKEYRILWANHPHWRGSIGEAVYLCLSAMAETGIFSENGTLMVFWVHKTDDMGDSGYEDFF